MPRLSLFDFGPLARIYDSWYDSEEGAAHDRIQKEGVVEALGCCPKSGRLLDVGSGTGHWSRVFSSLGFSVLGVDASKEMTGVAKEKGLPGSSFAVGDALNLPFRDAEFDAVSAMAALEFIPDAPAAVREMARLTKAGGLMLVGALNRLSPMNQERIARGDEPYASGRLLSPGELAGMLELYGPVSLHDPYRKPVASERPSGAAPENPFVIMRVIRHGI